MKTILKRIGQVFNISKNPPITSINQQGVRLEDFHGEFTLMEHGEAYEIPLALISRKDHLFATSVAKNEITAVNRTVYDSYHFTPFYRRLAMAGQMFEGIAIEEVISRMHLRGLVMFQKKESYCRHINPADFVEYGVFCPVIKNDWVKPMRHLLYLVATIRVPKAVYLSHDDTEIDWWTDERQVDESSEVSKYTLERVTETICDNYRFVATYSNSVRNVQLYF